MDGLNINKFGYSRKAGIIINEWNIKLLDKDGQETGEFITLALTYGIGLYGNDVLNLILRRTDGDNYVPIPGGIEEWEALLKSFAIGDVKYGALKVREALDWAEDHLDPNVSEFYGAIDEMRDFTDFVLHKAEH